MTRARSETIGTLGRSPARSQRIPPIAPGPGSSPPPPEKGWLRRWLHGAFAENLGLKFLSMVLAITVFLVVNDDKAREVTVRVPVAYQLPTDRVLTSGRIDEVRVTVKGQSRRLRRFDAKELGLLSIDLRAAQSGDIPFTPEMLNQPPGVTITDIQPHSLVAQFDKRTERVIEVSPAVAGRPQHGYIALEIKANPPTVKLRGAEKLLAAMPSVRTSDLTLDGRTETFTQAVKVDPPEGMEIVGPDSVQVHVQIDEELVTRKLPDVAVAVKGEGIDVTKWTVTPAAVEVTLTGALLAIEKTKDAMKPVIKLTAADKGPREAQVVVEGLPPGIGVRISPERVKVAPATK